MRGSGSRSRAFCTHHYFGAHNGEDAIVLYERAIPVIRSAGQKVKRVSNPSLELEVLRVAADHGMILAP
jgi:hypothetical protein